MFHNSLSRGASFVALLFVVDASAAFPQESLPSIDIGAAGAGAGDRAPRRGEPRAPLDTVTPARRAGSI